VRKRSRARELALQMLYQLDARGEDAWDLVDPMLQREEPGVEDVHEFARELIRGTMDKRDGIDVLLKDAAQNWKLHRMAVIDRNILRMAVFEMMNLDAVPAKVTINEAIELGKRFSTKQSGAFINGILDRIRREQNL
jgi:transcription antitermination factor NusB